MNNLALFMTSAVIWGSTWLMITFQLGVVAPLVSVVYRFSLASMILFGYSIYKKKSFRFSAIEHLLIFIQGIFLFGINYWLTYIGITKINSALAAVLSTSIVYFNVILARIFLGDKLKLEVIFGGTIGVIGIVMIFLPQIGMGSGSGNLLQSRFWQSEIWYGIVIVLVASLFASFGNIFSAQTQRRKIPVVQANALGMGYASLLLAIIAYMTGLKFEIVWSIEYVGSLIYLALFGSVIAFGAFLTVLGRIGPDKAGYISLVYPVIALIFSTIFEDYHWTILGFAGVLIIFVGNFIAMGKYKQFAIFKKFTPQTNG